MAKNKWFLHGSTLLLVVMGYCWYENASVIQLRWILQPTSTLVYLFKGLPFIFDADLGYVNVEKQIAITKSCSGMHFILMAFSLMAWSFLPVKNNTWWYNYIYLLVLLMASVAIAIIANVSRIVSAITLQQLFPTHYLLNTDSAHVALGALLYSFALVLFYFLGNFWFRTTDS